MSAPLAPEWSFSDDDRRFMAAALAEAEAAAGRGEVPVGAVVVRAGEAVALAGNQRQGDADPGGHAELIALRAAAAAAGDWRLSDATVYVTLEPCPMCTAALRQARVSLVVWGAPDPRLGACGSAIDLAGDRRLGPPLVHRGGLEAETSRELLQTFFARRRDSS